jgi:hypothetical protein
MAQNCVVPVHSPTSAAKFGDIAPATCENAVTSVPPGLLTPEKVMDVEKETFVPVLLLQNVVTG